MADLNTQLLLVGKLFLLLGIGLFFRRKNIISAEGQKMLTDLVIDLTLPCSIICSFLTSPGENAFGQTIEIFILSAAVQTVCYFSGMFLYLRCEEKHRTVLQYATVCSNSGILGTPIAEGIFGSAGALFAAVYLIPVRVVMWTLGLSFFTKQKSGFSPKKIITHPCVAAVLIGLVLMVTGITPPRLITETMRTVGNCNTAVSMILVGSIMAGMDIKLLLHRDTWYYSAIRLVALPLLLLLVCNMIQTTTLIRNISVILTAMPAGSTTAMLALKYDGDAEFASACIAVTTILSLAAVPVWCAILM